MTWAQRDAGTLNRLVRARSNGAQVTIRRAGDALIVPTTGAHLTTLAVNGTVAIGGSSLDLDAASVRGTLGKGWTFTLPGHTAPYVVQADVTAVSNEFSGVSISPVLSHEATDDAVVTITQPYASWSYYAARQRFTAEQMAADENIRQDDYILVVSALGASDVDILDGDVLTFDGKERTLVTVMPHEPGTVTSGWRLHCRG